MNFKDRLRDEMDFKDLKPKELSLLTNIPKQTIDSYVNSRAQIPKADAAVKLAKALDVTVEYLVTGEDSNNAKSDMEQYRKLRPLMDKLLFIPDEILKPIEAMIDAAYNTEFEKQKKQA